MFAILAMLSALGPSPVAWSQDFAKQPLANRPTLEARYEDATRRALVVEAQAYRLVIDLRAGRTRLRSLDVKGPTGPVPALSPAGAFLTATGPNGEGYSSGAATKPTRVNLYRRGPYYLEIHWFDVALAETNGKALPLRGDIALFAYPDRIYCQATYHATGAVDLKSLGARLQVAMSPAAGPKGARALLFASGRSGLAVLAPLCQLVGEPGGAETTTPAPATGTFKKGDKITHAFGLLPLPDLRQANARTAEELSPLPSSAFKVAKGSPVRWDAVRGCYVIGTFNPGNFSDHYYTYPNRYETATFTVRNTGPARKIVVCHETATGVKGLVECGVLQDAQGQTLPITVQISKNFAGEIEEKFYNPTDAAFSETYFPLYLGAGETRTLTSHHLYQNWGNHPLKQFSSLGAWMDYYHMSTGCTETTCYVPFKFDGLHGVQIADMRPFSQRMWPSQPQHDNVAGHTFLRYLEDGVLRDMEYMGTLFHSTGPNWANMSLLFRSEDSKVEGRLDCFELPQTDELRNFCKLRFNVLKPIRLANASTDFRVMNVRSYVQALRYQTAWWSDAGGKVGEQPIQFNGAPVAHQLYGAAPWLTLTQDTRGNNAIVVRSWKARLAGKSGIGPAMAVVGMTNKNSELMLTPWVDGPLTLQPGDYVECEIALVPYGPIGTEIPYATPQAEAARYGTRAPRVVSVQAGRKVSDFPTRVDADGRGRAQFVVSGGRNRIIIAVGNLPTYQHPRLYRKTASGWGQVPHSHTGEDGYQTFVDSRGRFGAVFLVDVAEGGAATYRFGRN